VGRKWENIKRSKGKIDQERGAVFSRIAKDIMKAAKAGGPDPEANIRLKTVVIGARKSNMPTDIIQRAILKGAGQLEGVRYEELIYEGYGPGGVAITMSVVTDNRNRTAADIRHAFTKAGGALGETGCVGWMFSKKGVIAIDRSQSKVSEDDLMMLVLDAGAEDIETSDESFDITTAPEALDGVLRTLMASKIPVERGEAAQVPTTTVDVTGDNVEKLAKLLDTLEANDDIQDVYSNAVWPDEE
jgi:YebC/PmpR family DNA-binding regulatory protein